MLLENLLLLIGASLIGYSWIVPIHNYPWGAAWSDGLAIIGLFILATLLFFRGKKIGVARLGIYLFALALACGFFQVISGINLFFSDVAISWLYFFIFLLAVAIGQNTEEKYFLRFIYILLFFLVISAFIGVAQWLGVQSIFHLSYNSVSDGRAYGNVNQANNFASLNFVSICLLIFLQLKNKISLFTCIAVAGLFLAAGFFSGSRTFFVQIFFLFSFFFFELKKSSAFSLRALASKKKGIAAIFALCAIGLLFFLLYDAPLESHRQDFLSSRTGLIRFYIWKTFLIAFLHHPFFGYGWQQLAAAHLEASHWYSIPAMNEAVEGSAHNLILDFLASSGLIFGLPMLVVFFALVLRAISAARQSPAMLPIAVAIGGVMIHSFLEYPLYYAYLLIPFGIFCGYALRASPEAHCIVGKKIGFSVVFIGVAIFVLIASDYLKVERYFSLVQLRATKTNIAGVDYSPPQVYLLKNLSSYASEMMQVASEAAPSVSDIPQLERVVMRYPFAQTLIPYAFALALDGQMKKAQYFRDSVCLMNPQAMCDDAHASWARFAKMHPQVGEWKELPSGASQQ